MTYKLYNHLQLDSILSLTPDNKDIDNFLIQFSILCCVFDQVHDLENN